MGDLKIGDAFSEGWNIYKDNMGTCILATLLAALIGAVSCGICAGPLFAGLFMMLRRLAKKSDPKPAVGDLFKGFDLFLPAFLLYFVCGLCYFVIQTVLFVIPIVGWIVAMLVAFAYGPMLVWSLMLVANRGMKWTEAVGFVLKQTLNGKFLLPILLGILAGLAGGIGAMLCGIGLIFTMPYTFCVYAAAYEQVFGNEGNAEPPVEPEVVS